MASVGKDFAPSVLRDHSNQATFSDAARGDLRGQVTLTLARRSNVRKNQRHDVTGKLPTIQNLHRRDAQAFLEDFARQAHGTGVRAADVGVMRAIGHIKRRPRCRRSEDGHYHRQVGQVRAPGVGIVEQRNVTRPKLERGDCRSHRHRHRPQVHGHVIAHRQDLSSAVEYCAGIVAAFLDIGREG